MRGRMRVYFEPKETTRLEPKESEAANWYGFAVGAACMALALGHFILG